MKVEQNSVVFHSDENQFWRNKAGERHRDNGPAVIYSNGSQIWYYCSQLHRVGGPAVIRSDGSEYWYLNDKQATQKAVER